ncbi:hypothetical protein E5222_13335 [Alteraurantiacibacter aquimixticola]|uniref:Transferrin-binding protein B C-lobe/N-lobe beta barrel domain-containing protein n=1 Tax=Alteraurantiacibacter aquimixticola TaxID=2489173 RepID=A0A4T3F1G4_9SPHN|nr:hypothetical protein E5222_13335 [Alteraurantiacibacter aquimixticola]
MNATAGVSFAVDPETAQFAFPDLSSPVEFDAADLAGSTANSRTYVDGDERLVLERPFTNVLSASYERKDSGIVGTEPGDIRSTRVVLVLNPVSTTDTIDADIAYTGTPVIDGGTPGTTPDGEAVGEVTTLTVDASEDAVVGTLRIFEDSGSGPALVATLPVDADLTNAGTFSQGATTLVDNGSGFSGALIGFLAGPNREEAALVFSISHDDGRKYVGQLVMQDTTP